MLYFAHEYLFREECDSLENKPYFESCVFTEEAKCYFLFQELLRLRFYLKSFIDFRANMLRGKLSDKDPDKIAYIAAHKLDMIVFAFARVNTLVKQQQSLYSFEHDEQYYEFYKATALCRDEISFIVDSLIYTLQVIRQLVRDDEQLEDQMSLIWKA